MADDFIDGANTFPGETRGSLILQVLSASATPPLHLSPWSSQEPQLVFGVRSVAQQISAAQRVRIYQSGFFEGKMPADNTVFEDLVITPPGRVSMIVYG